MRSKPKYLESTGESSRVLKLYIPAITWTFAVFLSCLIAFKTTPDITDSKDLKISQWVLSTSEELEVVRKLTLHLARDYQTVEFLADTSATASHLSEYWISFQRKHPYIEQIGATESNTGDQFFINQDNKQEIPLLTESQNINFIMQSSLLTNDDVLFYYYPTNSGTSFFRFSTPIHYQDIRLGHLHIDVNTEKLLSYIAQNLKSLDYDLSIIMLDKEGNFVASSSHNKWSARTALTEEISYYYPQMWRYMNSGLSGLYSNTSQYASYSKLDIPWYKEQIKYFYLIQLSDKVPKKSHTRLLIILFLLWVAGISILLFAQPKRYSRTPNE